MSKIEKEEDLRKKNWSNQFENPQSAHQSDTIFAADLGEELGFCMISTSTRLFGGSSLRHLMSSLRFAE
ncbi:PREDICTED: pectate lyase 12 isoform [Prunus dulcis]|uniref:PREDICTED: pectate lyase 12 isoform n=1 Tax=Prunus dulcis TaxID=3755 RepID=A0A5E4GED1_PRUDU|nr:PREDICTED: pectate lyase 12 isoform [Prunus dulcis]